jgi:murein DD-endopeptidase MepM/ murein hydrolase activator NlpD
MKGIVKRLGPLLLLTTVGLVGLVILETRQEVVGALELKGIPFLSNLPQSASGGNASIAIPQQQVPAGSLASMRSQPAAEHLSATASPSSVHGSPAAAHRVAISTGKANDPQQPIAQAMPTQVATGTWYGASFPVENFQAYTSPFGYRSSPDGGYSQEFHYGLDMAAPEGSYIRNWWGGKVVEVSDDSNCGTSVVLESGSWTHIYCHMEGHVETSDGKRYMIDREGGIRIAEGQQVPAGSRIGRVGMSGRTTGPHLHWGLKYNGIWVDPGLVLRAMYSSQQRAASKPTHTTIQ